MSVVDEVKARLDIVDVVGSYVRLQKAGRYFKAPCPFHTERTPSFIVYPDRQSWHCFGACSTGGDLIAFIAKKENLDFMGALRLLAERAGVELQNDGPRREEAKTLQDANEAAAIYYYGLVQNAAAARAYIDVRGLDDSAVRDFQIGYAPTGWQGLRDYLVGRGFAESRLIEAGLLVEGERGAYDRFRHRLMFPIRDDRGRIVGFGGRILPEAAGATTSPQNDHGPKYMNTPQTPIFDKGSILYGLERAKEPIRQSGSAIIVEGYMDVIAAHQHGHRNVVASMGTALTERQALLLQRFAARVVLAMDADEAGSAANLRAVQVVADSTERAPRPGEGRNRPRRLDVRVLALPHGKDPDELIRSEPAAWPVAIEAAKPVVDHLFTVVTVGRDLAQPQERSDLVAEVLPTVGEISDPVLQAHYLQRLSRLARVSEDALRRQLPRRGPAARRGAAAAVSPAGRTRDAAPFVQPKRAPREEFCLALLYQEATLAQRGAGLSGALFSLSENRELLRRWQAGLAITDDEPELWEHYQDVLTTRIPQAETAAREAAFLDCVRRLEDGRMRAVKEASSLALAEGEAGVRPGEIASIARAMQAEARGETDGDVAANAAASQLIEDTENGLRLHRRLIEGKHPDRTGSA